MYIEAELKLHPDALTMEDEWSGVTNPALRRKLQNRLNKRAARRRHAEKIRKEDGAIIEYQPTRDTEQIKGALACLCKVRERAQTSQRWLLPELLNTPYDYGSTSSDQPLTMSIDDRKSQISRLYRKIMQEKDSRTLYPLPSDHLLSLVYYNVYRALIANVAVLGLDLDLMASDDYPSPFTPFSPTASSALRSLPANLRPTKLQRTIAHHPMWDIIPDAVSRDNILRQGQENINDVELCLDLIGTETRRQKHESKELGAGCTVWGDPWVLSNWEVDESLVRGHPWMFVGASEIERATNKWRRVRGEKPLQFALLGVPRPSVSDSSTSEGSWRSGSSPESSV